MKKYHDFINENIETENIETEKEIVNNTINKPDSEIDPENVKINYDELINTENNLKNFWSTLKVSLNNFGILSDTINFNNKKIKRTQQNINIINNKNKK